MNMNLEEIKAIRMLATNGVETPIDIKLERKHFLNNEAYVFVDHEIIGQDIYQALRSEDPRVQVFDSKYELDYYISDVKERNPEYPITEPIKTSSIEFVKNGNTVVLTPEQSKNLNSATEKIVSLMESNQIKPYFKLNDLVEHFKANKQDIGNKSIVEITQEISRKKAEKQSSAMAM